MNIIGIDVSKNELIGVRIDRAGKETENYKFRNNSDSINIFLHDVAQKHRHLVIACESTSYFHRNLALTCISQNIPFHLINPITTKQFVKVTVRDRKTDMSDALIIAKLALHGEGRYMQKEDFSFNKSISRTASKLSEMERSVGRMISRLNTVEDEEMYVVSDELKICRQTLEIGMKKLRKYLHKKTDKTLRKLLTSIPGVGPTTADILIAEIGNIDKFHSGKSLVAFSGIDPRVKQSGATLKRNTKITKQSSPHLRHILYFATVVAQMHYKEFKDHYAKKIAE